MCTLVVLGAGGQLGRALMQAASDGWRVTGLTRADIDADEAGSVERRLAALAPEVIVNAVALTDVDGCEREPERAHRINAVFPGEVARASAALGARLIHVSTDYVFGGGPERTPLDEGAARAPVNHYGRTKAEGEDAVLSADPAALVARISAVFGAGGASGKGGNFVDAILQAARTRPEVRVVADQVVSPTHAPDAARAILHLAARGAPGVWHAAGQGAASWFELAQAAVDGAGLATPVTPIATTDWPTLAARPAWSALDGAKLAASGFVMPGWREGLAAYLAR